MAGGGVVGGDGQRWRTKTAAMATPLAPTATGTAAAGPLAMNTVKTTSNSNSNSKGRGPPTKPPGLPTPPQTSVPLARDSGSENGGVGASKGQGADVGPDARAEAQVKAGVAYLAHSSYEYAANNPIEDRHRSHSVRRTVSVDGGGSVHLAYEVFLVVDGHGGALASQVVSKRFKLEFRGIRESVDRMFTTATARGPPTLAKFCQAIRKTSSQRS